MNNNNQNSIDLHSRPDFAIYDSHCYATSCIGCAPQCDMTIAVYWPTGKQLSVKLAACMLVFRPSIVLLPFKHLDSMVSETVY